MNKPSWNRIINKFNWASGHVEKFEQTMHYFAKDYPNILVHELDNETGEKVCRVNEVPVLPDTFSLIMGDALHNLRSTLDYLVCELVRVQGNEPTTQTAFPIFDNQELYQKGKARRTKGMSTVAVEAIDRIEPWRDGEGHMLWRLHKLNNIDKHRILLTMALVNMGRTMTDPEKAQLRSGQRETEQTKINVFDWILNTSRSAPLTPGQEIFRIPPGQDISFAVDVAVPETEVAEGVPVFILLRDTRDTVVKALSTMYGHL
jgi:hypothetical protein